MNHGKALLNGSADVAFVMLPELSDPNFIVYPLKEERVVVVGGPDTPMDALGKNDRDQKLREVFIANGKDCIYRAMFEKYLEERGLVISQLMELWSIEAIKRCVRRGLGITCLPLTAAFLLFSRKSSITKTSGFLRR
ncbi:LysR family transcriptional regulator substrate-binding protein [Brevibacillus formosus]|uniref:LysR family transcriptional regulator substrate-binding protein n=1 Tax=Brevibacillus formosus TaxID=54913 RepID=UPI003F1D2F35